MNKEMYEIKRKRESDNIVEEANCKKKALQVKNLMFIFVLLQKEENQ